MTNAASNETSKTGMGGDTVHFEKPELEHGDGIEEDSPQWQATEKSLVRKIDMTLLPLVWLLYLFNYLDRNNIAQAQLNGFSKDLGLVSNQFNIAVSILNIGYMLMQLPSNMIMTRTRPSVYIPVWTALWSIVSACTALANNYTHLIVIRFFLGIVEAPFFPGATYLLSSWYTRKELAMRIAILYSGLILATAFSGLIAAGIFAGLDQVNGMAGWKWLFIIEGAGSFVAALIAFAFLPDYPGDKSGVCKWLLTDEEQRVAVLRMERDRVTLPSENPSVWNGVKLAVKDIRTWIFSLMLMANHSAYGFNNFFPTIVQGFKLGNTTTTLVLTAPPYLVATVIAFIGAYSSDRRQERGYHISVPQGVAVIGFIISVATLDTSVRYFAAFLYVGGCFASNAVVFGWASGTLGQTAEKRAAATAIINLSSQLGNIYSPYFFQSTDSPRYVLAMILMMVFSFLSIVTCMVMKWILKKENKKILESGDNVRLYLL